MIWCVFIARQQGLLELTPLLIVFNSFRLSHSLAEKMTSLKILEAAELFWTTIAWVTRVQKLLNNLFTKFYAVIKGNIIFLIGSRCQLEFYADPGLQGEKLTVEKTHRYKNMPLKLM